MNICITEIIVEKEVLTFAVKNNNDRKKNRN